METDQVVRKTERKILSWSKTTIVDIGSLHIGTTIEDIVDTAFHEKGIRDLSDRHWIVARRRITIWLVNVREATSIVIEEERSLLCAKRRIDLRDHIRAGI